MTGMPSLAVLLAIVLLLAGCRGDNPAPPAPDRFPTGGSAARGRDLIEQFECGTCHTIPGVRAAHGLVAPPLVWFSQRSFVAGELPNTPRNLVQWIRDPRAVEPRTAMPTLGVSEEQALDIAAYLYTLR